MESWGNARANAYYEGNMPKSVRLPQEGDPVRVIERFIRDKYELKKYIANDIPDKDTSTEMEAVVEEAPRRRSVATKPTTTKPPVVTAPIAPAPEPSLLDFMDDPVPAPAPAVPAGFQSPTSTQQQQQAAFGNFDDSQFGQFQTGQAVSTGGFDAFNAPAPAPVAQVSVVNFFYTIRFAVCL